MASRIPEEILREILQHSLSIWPVDAILTQPLPSLTKRVEDNRNCSERSDLDKGLPQPDPLLVCKRWLRVGTPLFYHTIVLFDKPQVLLFFAESGYSLVFAYRGYLFPETGSLSTGG